MDRLRQVDLLLLGKTGHGKSATGNSILKREAFKSKFTAKSVTAKISSEVSEYNGLLIKVVDGPGVGDTRMNNQEGVNLVKEAMTKAIALNDRGYHSFLLVIRAGARYNVEDHEAIDLLKSIFGASFIKNYCIIVFTYGDNFEKNSEKTGQTFEEWCEEQDGALKTLYLECEKRAVLFDNETKDESKKNKQLDKLLNMVDSLQYQGRRYCDKHFEKAKETREKAAVKAKEPQIRESIVTETSLIVQKLQQIEKMQTLEDQLEQLKELQGRCDALYEQVKEQDKGTGALYHLFETVEFMRRNVQVRIEVCQRMIVDAELRQKEDQRSKEERERMENIIKEQKEEHDRQMERQMKAEEQRSQEQRERMENIIKEQKEELLLQIEKQNRAEEQRSKEEREKIEKITAQHEAVLRELERQNKEGEQRSQQQREMMENIMKEQKEELRLKMEKLKEKEEKRSQKEREKTEKLMAQQEQYRREMERQNKEEKLRFKEERERMENMMKEQREQFSLLMERQDQAEERRFQREREQQEQHHREWQEYTRESERRYEEFRQEQEEKNSKKSGSCPIH